MNRPFILLILCFWAFSTKAQSSDTVQPFGKIDRTDLELKQCDFEKDANAEVLFTQTLIHYKYSTVEMEYHKRIKIFNDKGNDASKVRIEYYGAHNNESISDIQAETVNLNNDVIEYTPVDKSLIYTQDVNKLIKAVVFTFPNIKPGSIVEFKYKWSSPYAGNLPDWVCQQDIPVRYSEFKGELSNDYTFKFINRMDQKLKKDTSYYTNGKNVNQGETYIWAVDSVRSFRAEPFMNSDHENLQHISFQVTGRFERNWSDIVRALMSSVDFGNELDTRIYLNKEDEILAKVGSLSTQDEKIAYVYNLVKSSMKYNGQTSIFTDSEIKKAWSRKEGNAAEINFIVYHFLKNAGLEPLLVLLNTHKKIETDYATLWQLNIVAVYLTGDSSKVYLLDAANKDGLYNQIPYYALNSNALIMSPKNSVSHFVVLENLTQVRKSISINAEIMPDAKMEGTAQINSGGYFKLSAVKKYNGDGEKKYSDYLRNDNNNLEISALKIKNIDIDTLPLIQNINFSLKLPGSDEQYIYFSPNLFTEMNFNPFLSEERFSDIDFKYLTAIVLSGRYKIPNGFKVEALPRSVMVLMPDRSIILKRIINMENGYIVVNFTIDSGRSYYTKDEYPQLKDFYKKMYEMLNEQIVLKKTQ